MSVIARLCCLCCLVLAAFAAGAGRARAAEADLLSQVRIAPVLPSGIVESDLDRVLLKRIPAFRVPRSAAQWQREAERLRQRILSECILAGIPRAIIREKPRVEWGETLEAGPGYSIRKLRYEGYPGMWVPALLYLPDKVAGRVPVVLNVNGHVGPPGKAIEYEQIRCVNLAKRGMIALHPEWLSFGELNAPGYSHDRLLYLDLCGHSGVAVFYLHLKRALDLLLDLPNADPKRVAVTGLSGGGWQTILISSLDTRVTAAIPNAGYIGTRARVSYSSDVGDEEQQPNDLGTIADYVHLTALLAPRAALLIYNVRDDCCFQSDRARRSVFEPVERLYDLLGAGDRFEYHENVDPGTHNYDLDNRQALYRFLNKHFLAGAAAQDEEIPCAGELLSGEALTVGLPPDNATFTSLAQGLARKLPTRKVTPRSRQAFTTWRSRARERLTRILRCKSLSPVKPTLLEETTFEGRPIRVWRLELGGEWTLPAVEYGASGDPAAPVALVVADGGKSESARVVSDVLKAGHRVIAFDVLFSGECTPSGRQGYQSGLLCTMLGARPLGIQVAQIEAVAKWASQGRAPCHLVAIGKNVSVAAAAATALDKAGRIARLTTYSLPATLGLLLEEDAGCRALFPLYCFGLLRDFDVRELLAMCAERQVECRQMWGNQARIQAELGDLGEVFRRLGGNSRITIGD